MSVHLILVLLLPCRSYHPYWEGKICVESLPVHNLTPVVMKESGTVKKITGWTFVAGGKPVRVCSTIGTYTVQITHLQGFSRRHSLLLWS